MTSGAYFIKEILFVCDFGVNVVRFISFLRCEYKYSLYMDWCKGSLGFVGTREQESYAVTGVRDLGVGDIGVDDCGLGGVNELVVFESEVVWDDGDG